MFLDENNAIWLGTYGKGIWRIHNRKWPIYTLANFSKQSIDKRISALALDKKGFMWVGSFRHLYRYFFETNSLSPVFPNSRKENPFAQLQINQITQNENGLRK